MAWCGVVLETKIFSLVQPEIQPETLLIFSMQNKTNPYHKNFIVQRARAKNRGIEWMFTFEEWLAIWETSGKLHLRGRGVGKYVMSRFGDVGPYSPTNVEISPYEKNASDVSVNHKSGHGGASRFGLERGCYRVQRGLRVTYVSRFRKKHLGVFSNPEDASEAYKKAFNEYMKSK